MKTIAYSRTGLAIAALLSGLVFAPACSESGAENETPPSTASASSTASSSSAQAAPAAETLAAGDRAQATSPARSSSDAARKLLEGRPLEAIAPLVGAWEIDAQWAFGQKLWGRSTYDVTLGGGWVEVKAIVADAGADPYHRYTSLIGYDSKADAIIATDFTSDGSVRESTFSRTEDGGFETRWSMGDLAIRETILPKGDSFDWDVWTQEPGSEDWSHIMDDSWSQTSEAMPRHSLPDLDEGLAVLEPFIGEWVIDTEWAWGTPLKARSTYSKDVGGRFIKAATYPTEGDEGEYHRYLSFFRAVDDGIRVYGFVYDGTKAIDELTVISLDPPIFEIMLEQDDGGYLRQRVEMTTPDSYRWQVWNRPGNYADWSSLMDGVWRRVSETASNR